MKKIIGWLFSWILYLIGDVVSRIMHISEPFERLYFIYNYCMTRSVAVQDWSGNYGPWENVGEEDQWNTK